MNDFMIFPTPGDASKYKLFRNVKPLSLEIKSHNSQSFYFYNARKKKYVYNSSLNRKKLILNLL